MDTNQISAFRKLSKNIQQEESFYKQVFTILSKWKYTILLFIDIATHIHNICIGNGDFKEGGLTISLHILSVVSCFPVVRYSSSSLCWDLILMFFGLYEIKWYLRKDRNDTIHKGNVRKFLRSTGRAPKEEERSAVVSLYANNMVDVNLSFNGVAIPAFIMTLMKLYFQIYHVNPEETCSLTTVTRILLILVGLWEPMKICYKYDKTSLRYLISHNFAYFLDSGYRFELNQSLDNFWTSIIFMLFHFIFISYRVLTLMVYFEHGVIIGLIHFFYLICLSWLYHVYLRPHYENPPVGVPTWISDIIEILAKMMTLRNTHICELSFLLQIRARFYFYFVISSQHFIPVFILYLFSLCYYIPEPVHHDIFNSLNCNNGTMYFWLSSSLETFGSNLQIHYGNQNNLSKFIFQSFHFYFFVALIIVSSIHFLTLHLSGLIQDRFPAHTAINIWEKKFLIRQKWNIMKYDNDTPSWLPKMLLISILSQKDFESFLKNKPMSAEEWRDLCANEVRKLPMEATKTSILAFLVGHPMEIKLVELIQFVDQNNMFTNGNKLAYLFCLEFENLMENMNSKRIADICKILDVSPIIASEFTEDTNSCFLFFK